MDIKDRMNRASVQHILMSRITISDRIRQDMGDIDSLAKDIEAHGLINPILVLDASSHEYSLIAGRRRYEAAKQLGWERIRVIALPVHDALELLELEIAENEARKEFTPTERLSYADKLKAIETQRGRERMALYAHAGQGVIVDENNFEAMAEVAPHTASKHEQALSSAANQRSCHQGVGECPHPDENKPTGVNRTGQIACHTATSRPQYEFKARSREVIAKKVGFSSDRQMRRAEALLERRPDLLSRVDRGELSISGADAIMRRESGKPTVADQFKPSPEKLRADLKRPRETFVEADRIDALCPPIPLIYMPQVEDLMGDDTIEGAGHQQLMRNPVYAKLFGSYQDYLAYAEALRSFCEGKLQTLRSHRQNHNAMEERINQPATKNMDLRTKLAAYEEVRNAD
jgi:ParB family chromosome partitioning protein